MIIDLTKKQPLNESWLKMMGNWSKSLLKYMYDDGVTVVAGVNQPTISRLVREEGEEEANGPKFILRGKHKDVKAYATAIVKEKDYLDAIVEFGEGHLQTARAKEELNMAVDKFESTTGLIWPFKDEE